jgi:two-component system, OmpR family, response regulator
MTVTPLPSRPSARRRTRSAAAAPALTLTVDVTLAGERRFTDAQEVLETLRWLTDRLGTASLSVSPMPESTEPARRDPAVAPLIDDDILRVFPDSRTARHGAQPVVLSRLEFELLLFLAENPRRVFTRLQLLHSVWGHRHTGERSVDVHIRRLRAKAGRTPLVTTVRGVGYRLADDARVLVVAPRRTT